MRTLSWPCSCQGPRRCPRDTTCLRSLRKTTAPHARPFSSKRRGVERTPHPRPLSPGGEGSRLPPGAAGRGCAGLAVHPGDQPRSGSGVRRRADGGAKRNFPDDGRHAAGPDSAAVFGSARERKAKQHRQGWRQAASRPRPRSQPIISQSTAAHRHSPGPGL